MAGRNLRSYKDSSPRVHGSAFIDGSAQVIGDVIIKEDCSVYPGAIIRGDEETVIIDRGAQVMDVAFIEAPRGHPVRVGERSVIGHGAILHGCEIGKECLIGIGALVLDGSRIGDGCIVAAGILVPEAMVVQKRSMVMGLPAKVTRRIVAKDLASIRKAQKEARRKAQVYMGMQTKERGGPDIHR